MIGEHGVQEAGRGPHAEAEAEAEASPTISATTIQPSLLLPVLDRDPAGPPRLRSSEERTFGVERDFYRIDRGREN